MTVRAQKRQMLKDGNVFTYWRVIRAKQAEREFRLNRVLSTRPRARRGHV